MLTQPSPGRKLGSPGPHWVNNTGQPSVQVYEALCTRQTNNQLFRDSSRHKQEVLQSSREMSDAFYPSDLVCVSLRSVLSLNDGL